MSTKHTPPRQNVHRGRSPVNVPAVSAGSAAATVNGAVRKINARLAANGAPARGATPGQIVSATKTS